MNIFITGIAGKLGWNLYKELTEQKHSIQGTIHSNKIDDISFFKFDFEGGKALLELSDKITPPDLIIHCAAWTDVDGCQKQPQKAQCINTNSTKSALELADYFDSKLVYVSTDYVFDGDSGNYTEESPTNPKGVYGLTKLRAEEPVLKYKKGIVVRWTPLHYKYKLPHHSGSILDRIQKCSLSNTQATLFEDKITAPVTSVIFAKLLTEVLDSNAYGLFHFGYEDKVSLYQIGKKIEKQYGISNVVTPATHPDNDYTKIRPIRCNLLSSRIKLPSLQENLMTLPQKP